MKTMLKTIMVAIHAAVRWRTASWNLTEKILLSILAV